MGATQKVGHRPALQCEEPARTPVRTPALQHEERAAMLETEWCVTGQIRVGVIFTEALIRGAGSESQMSRNRNRRRRPLVRVQSTRDWLYATKRLRGPLRQAGHFAAAPVARSAHGIFETAQCVVCGLRYRTNSSHRRMRMRGVAFKVLSYSIAALFATGASTLFWLGRAGAQVSTKWEIHDRNRPQPPVVTPGSASTQERAG